MASITLPRFMVIKSCENDYLGVMHGMFDGYLSFVQSQAVSPYTKFEVENSASHDCLVHIRCCLNNKYWARSKNHLSLPDNVAEQYWITATVTDREENRSMDSCTLFEPIPVDPEMNTVRFMHVPSGAFLCFWPIEYTRCVLASYNYFDDYGRDIFTIIDWDSFLILPKHLAFKGDIGQYLCLREINDKPFLQFATDDITDPTVPCEISYTNDGNIRINCASPKVFWSRNSDGCDEWILADSEDASSNDENTLFRPVKINDNKIALLNLGNNNFCKRYTIGGIESGFSAIDPSLSEYSELTVEEVFLTRAIYDFNYHFLNSRVYDQTVHMVAQSSTSNYSQQTTTCNVNLSYVATRTSTWNTNFSLKLGIKANNDLRVPLIINGKVELSSEVQSGVEWGYTTTSTTVLEIKHQVDVPPMTKVTVNLLATEGKCDVPFTYIQEDTLFDGSIVTTKVQGGTYIGSNYYNLNFQTIQEPLITSMIN